MKFQIIFFLDFISIIFAIVQNSLIIDYFIYTKVTSVIGFSCNNEEGDSVRVIYNLFYTFNFKRTSVFR